MLRIDYGREDERSHFVRDVDDGRHLLRLHVHLEDLALVGAHVDQRRRILHHRRDDTIGNGHVNDGTVESGFRDRPKLFVTPQRLHAPEWPRAHRPSARIDFPLKCGPLRSELRSMGHGFPPASSPFTLLTDEIIVTLFMFFRYMSPLLEHTNM